MNYIRRPSSDVIKTGQQRSPPRTCGHSSNLGHADTPYPGHANDSRCERFQKFTSIPVLEVAPYACNRRRLFTESAPGLRHQTQRMPCNEIAHQPRVRTGGPLGRCLENQLLAPASSLKSFACLYSPSRVVDYLAVSCLFSMPGFSADAQSNIFRQIDME